jgi:transcriptional regulator with XRE-family HTH domain
MLTRQPPPPNFEWTAESIHALRAHLGQSQAALARELGIRQQTVSEWETGMYKPRGASVTILTLLAVSSGFEFDRPEARETQREVAPAPTPSASRRISAPASNGTFSSSRPIRGPRSHPDWIRSTSASVDTPRTRNFTRQNPGTSGYRDGEIPM